MAAMLSTSVGEGSHVQQLPAPQQQGSQPHSPLSNLSGGLMIRPSIHLQMPMSGWTMPADLPADDDFLPPGAAPAPMPAGVAATMEPDPDVSQEGPLALKTRIEYSALPRGQIRAVFGLITVEASEALSKPANDESERHPMDIVCVLDVSGSMESNNKIQDLQNAVRFIIDEATPQDRLSIVTFNSAADRKLRLRRMDSEGRDDATQQTLRLSAGGGTSIGAGLDLGLAVLEKRRQRNKVSAILLLTDGQDSSTRQQLPALLARANRIGCGVYGFGFGADHDAKLLQEISEAARTPYTFVETTSTVRAAFAGVVGGLSSIVAQNVEIKLNLRVPLKELNTPFNVLRDGDQIVTVIIPDIFSGERRDLLVELEVPAEPQSHSDLVVLLEASARYLDLCRNGVVVQTASVAMAVQRVEEPQPEMEPDEEVTDQRERVAVTRLLERAAACSDEGRFEEAQNLLRNQRFDISKRKNRTPVAVALDQELQDAEQRMKSAAEWRVGHAEIKDACQMHIMQRCTNMTVSASSHVNKTSKAMYCHRDQKLMMDRSASSSGP